MAHQTTANSSQILLPARAMMQVYVGGDAGIAHDVIQFSPVEATIGMLWEMPLKDRIELLRGLGDRILRHDYTPVIASLEGLITTNAPDYGIHPKRALSTLMEELKQGVIRRNLSHGPFRSAKLLTYDGEVVSAPPESDPELQEAGVKRYMHRITAQVTSLEHSFNSGPNMTVTVNNRSLGRFGAGQTVFTSDDAYYMMAELHNQQELADGSILSTHFMSRYVSAMIASMARAGDRQAMLPFQPTNEQIGEIIFRYYLQSKNRDPESMQLPIDLRFISDVRGFTAPVLISSLYNGAGLRVIQRNRFAKRNSTMLEDRILKNALVELMEKQGMMFVGYGRPSINEPKIDSELWIKDWNPKSQQGTSYELIFWEGLPMIMERTITKRDPFDFYGSVIPVAAMSLERSVFIQGKRGHPEIRWEGPLYCWETGRYSKATLYMPRVDDLEFKSTEEKKLVNESLDRRLKEYAAKK